MQQTSFTRTGESRSCARSGGPADAELVQAGFTASFKGESFRVYFAPPQATKDLEKGARLLSRQVSGVYTLHDSGPWEKASLIIEALRNRDLAVARVYLCSDDEERASQVLLSPEAAALRKQLRESSPTLLSDHKFNVIDRTDASGTVVELGRQNGTEWEVAATIRSTNGGAVLDVSPEVTLPVGVLEAFLQYARERLTAPGKAS